MTNDTKNHSGDLRLYFAICEAQNADKARTLKTWEYDLMTNSVKFMQQTSFHHCYKTTVVFVTITSCSPPISLKV